MFCKILDKLFSIGQNSGSHVNVSVVVEANERIVHVEPDGPIVVVIVNVVVVHLVTDAAAHVLIALSYDAENIF